MGISQQFKTLPNDRILKRGSRTGSHLARRPSHRGVRQKYRRNPHVMTPGLTWLDQ